MGSWYDRDLIVSTMKSNNFDRVATAKLFDCHPVTITRQMQMAARAEGKPYINQKNRGKRATCKPSIRWGHEALMKLTAILARDPVPAKGHRHRNGRFPGGAADRDEPL